MDSVNAMMAQTQVFKPFKSELPSLDRMLSSTDRILLVTGAITFPLLYSSKLHTQYVYNIVNKYYFQSDL